MTTRKTFKSAAWVLALFVLSSLCLCASQPRRVLAVRPISVDDGLSQSHVTCIAQDRQGFVWLGTAVGLNRYDGHQFETFSHDPGVAASLSNDAIYALHVDGRGRIWVGTGVGLDLYDARLRGFRRMGAALFQNPARSGQVRAIDSDSEGNLWLALSEAVGSPSLVVRFHPDTRAIRRYEIPSQQAGNIVHVHAQSTRRILIVSRDPEGRTLPNGFAVGSLDPESGVIRQFALQGALAGRLQAADERDISFAAAGEKSLWIGAPGHAVYRVEVERGTVTPHEYEPALRGEPPAELVSHVVAGREGEVVVVPTWRRAKPRKIGGELYVLNAGGARVRSSVLRPKGACDLSRSFVISSLIDHTDVLWVGISGAGLCVTDLQSGMFSHIHETSTGASLANNFVRSAWKTPQGVLWVGTRSGLTRIDRTRGSAENIRHEPGRTNSLSDDEVRAVLVDRSGTLWVGTQNGGLNRSRDEGRSFEALRFPPGSPEGAPANHISALLEDREGTLWVAALGGGLNRMPAASRPLATYRMQPEGGPASGSDKLTSLFEDAAGRLWVGTEDAGLFLFDRASGRFTAVDLGVAKPTNVVAITEDPQSPGVLWIGTLRQGLIRHRIDQRANRVFTARNSLLPSSTIYSVLADGVGFIWAGTNQGLVRLDPRDDSFRIFALDQGLQSMEFNTRASFRAPDGEMLFGGIGGLNAFYPSGITQNTIPPEVRITQVRTLNPRRKDADGLYETVYRDDGLPARIDLAPQNREVIFRYVALHYADPSRNRYRVKLEGFEETWRDMGTQREVTYTNLAPGPYKFLVQAVTSRGVPGPRPAVFEFQIARPFYAQPWFVPLAAAGLFAAGFSSHRFRLRKLRAAKHKLESEVAQRTKELTEALSIIGQQTEQLRESDALKSRFLTNVSHDFRTPLTVTLGTLADLRSGRHGTLTPEFSQRLETVMRSERRLLRLVEQMLAIARMESGKLELRMVRCDLAALAGEIVSVFQPAAERKQVELRLHGGSPMWACCDPDWTGQAITNLVVNALQYSPAGGTVRVEVLSGLAAGQVRLQVSDEGPGITVGEAARIFDRFYQTQSGMASSYAGMGVGLSLVKEIMELHHGEVSVTSTPGEGAKFQLVFPAGGDHSDTAEWEPASSRAVKQELEALVGDLICQEMELGDEEQGADRKLLVIAEDDRDLREYLRTHLGLEYRLRFATSGEAAWTLVQAEVPDVVVSDVMMPGMDGYELCRRIRSTPETGFVPVVLLTAKAETSARIEGLDCGADDYVSKPFEIVELRARIRNLLASRERLRARFAGERAPDAVASAAEVPESADAVFLQKVTEAIRRNAHRQDFGVAQLSKELAISRMHLYRRLSELVGKSPADVLMEYRLERASELLRAQAGNVSEVAYGTGFKSVSHFTKRFRERFGHTPSEHRFLRQQSGALD